LATLIKVRTDDREELVRQFLGWVDDRLPFRLDAWAGKDGWKYELRVIAEEIISAQETDPQTNV
jgi:hypothetical protein